MSFDRVYIIFGFAWLLASMVFGMYIGINGITIHSNAHAHAGLLGFVVSVLFGLLHRGWPALGSGRLAWPQLALYQGGVLALVVGKYQVDETGHSLIIAPGGVVVLIGTLLMMGMFLAKSAAHPGRAAIEGSVPGSA